MTLPEPYPGSHFPLYYANRPPKGCQAIAEAAGATWWVTNTASAEEKVVTLNNQVAAGVPTYAFLYAGHDSWRTRILQVSRTAADFQAEAHLLPDGSAGASDGRLAMKLTAFEPMPVSWRGEG